MYRESGLKIVLSNFLYKAFCICFKSTKGKILFHFYISRSDSIYLFVLWRQETLNNCSGKYGLLATALNIYWSANK